jgi:hypothetical protein
MTLQENEQHGSARRTIGQHDVLEWMQEQIITFQENEQYCSFLSCL